jgi:hypothetical protein
MGIFQNLFGSGKVKTGGQFNRTYGPESLEDKLIEAKIKGGSSTSNLSHTDLKIFEDIIAKYAKMVPAGAKFSGHTKYKMRMEGHTLFKQNKISWEDLKDFEKIVKAL